MISRRFTTRQMMKAVGLLCVLIVLALNMRLVFNWCPPIANDMGHSYIDCHVGWRNTRWFSWHCYRYRDKESHGSAYIGPWEVWSNYEEE